LVARYRCAPEQNIIDSATTVTLSDPSDRRRDRGNSLTDRRHVLNLTRILIPQFHGSSKLAKYLLNLNRLSVEFATLIWPTSRI
jgi:hypothetical protein